MEIKRVTAVVFSPTGGSKKYGAEIAKALSPNYRLVDLTTPEQREGEYIFTETDLVVFAAPVYYGRLPQVEGGIFSRCRGNNTPAVFNAVYGNREFDDALLEEKELLEAQGFLGLAAGAWIAPHSYSDRVAANRPNVGDLTAAHNFAAAIKNRLKKDSLTPGALTVPGANPYKEVTPLSFAPQGNDNCVDCRTCVKVCPTGAIDHEEPTKTRGDKCILCMACVKECPWDSREVTDPAFKSLAQSLEEKLLLTDKSPQTFIAP